MEDGNIRDRVYVRVGTQQLANYVKHDIRFVGSINRIGQGYIYISLSGGKELTVACPNLEKQLANIELKNNVEIRGTLQDEFYLRAEGITLMDRPGFPFDLELYNSMVQLFHNIRYKAWTLGNE